MKRMLIIPDYRELDISISLAKEYEAGFEYNDFVAPEVLDGNESLEQVILDYQRKDLPELTTVHGAFYDVIPFSVDRKIQEISDLRIHQSIAVTKKMKAESVVFHTNYNPFLNSEVYKRNWIEENAAYWSCILEENPDVNIYLENMFDTTPDLLEQISNRLCQYENYGVCLDYAHAFLSKTAPEEWARRLARFVKHVHISDNDGISDLHMAWGDGIINKDDFYQNYCTYLNGAAILMETTGNENIKKSLLRLKKDGFLE